MKNFFVLALMSVLLAGCESDAPKGGSGPQVGEVIGGIRVTERREITGAEREIGKRICQNLRTKRQKMETLGNEEVFRLRVESKTCNYQFPSMSEFSVSISRANPTDLEYESNNAPNYFKDIMTDENGVMAYFCPALLNSTSTSNEIINGNSQVRVSFVLQNNFDTIQISKHMKDANGNMSLVSTESVAIITQDAQANSKYFGIEKERTRFTKCANVNDPSYTKQTWVGANGNYPFSEL